MPYILKKKQYIFLVFLERELSSPKIKNIKIGTFRAQKIK